VGSGFSTSARGDALTASDADARVGSGDGGGAPERRVMAVIEGV
jgi:hypothetical protein